MEKLKIQDNFLTDSSKENTNSRKLVARYAKFNKKGIAYKANKLLKPVKKCS